MKVETYEVASIDDVLKILAGTEVAPVDDALYGIVTHGCKSCESAYVESVRDKGIPLFKDKAEAQSFVDVMLLLSGCKDGKGKVVEAFIA